ncbi:TPA: hypothetical protein ACF1F0_002986, partial [Escherichia coli]
MKKNKHRSPPGDELILLSFKNGLNPVLTLISDKLYFISSRYLQRISHQITPHKRHLRVPLTGCFLRA